MGATDVVQFSHNAAFARAIRFVGGQMEVYADGSFADADQIPSEELLAIFSEYSAAVVGLSLLLRGADYVMAKESEIYDMADRAYDGIA